MRLFSRAAHWAIQLYQKSSHDLFLGGLKDIEKIQRDKLAATLKYLHPYLKDRDGDGTYEKFKAQFPVTSYQDYQELFLDLKHGRKKDFPPVVRFQPTSGSTSSIKWIPYTEQLIKDFDLALGPWLYDLYSQHPQVLAGPHYWSLSWLPEDLRQEGIRLNDVELFPFWKRLLLNQTMAVTAPVDLAGTSESSLFSTVALLITKEHLSFISVWSPTFFSTLIKMLELYQNDIAQSLIEGKWTRFADELKWVQCPRNVRRGRALKNSTNPKVLWPQLNTLSCWTTSTSSYFAQNISQHYPHLKILGKGLWSTEAVVTIPYLNKYLLATQSHFFEFEDVGTGEVVPSWALRKMQKVLPIVTTSGGLIRYKMDDVLEVVDFIESTPCLNFLGRSDGVDMVGEKVSALRAEKVLRELIGDRPCQEAYLFAVKSPSHHRYCAVINADNMNHVGELSVRLEQLMQNSFHYKLARELKQLAPATVTINKKAHEGYVSLHLRRGMVFGNIKNEVLRLISEEELQENFK